MPFYGPILYHSPTRFIGSNLSSFELRVYNDIKNEIDRLRIENERSKKVILIVCKKFIEAEMSLGDCFYTDTGTVSGGSYAVLKCVVKYLRHFLIDVPLAAIYLRIICLIDALIRRGGFTAHWLIGQKRFLQTISLTGRRWKLPVNLATDPYANEAHNIAMDCIMAWHEGFLPVRSIFPFYSQTFYKLKRKYHIQFLRAENDPSRPPISFDRCDPNLLEEQDFLFNESIDTTEHAYSDTHVSYSVYNQLYDHSSFMGAPKSSQSLEEEDEGGGEEGEENARDFMIDPDGQYEVKREEQEEELPPFQFSNPKSEALRKSVSIDDKPQYFEEEGGGEPGPRVGIAEDRGNSFRVEGVSVTQVEEEGEEEEDVEAEREKAIAKHNNHARRIDEDRAFELDEDHDTESDSLISSHKKPPISPNRGIVFAAGELTPDSSPLHVKESSYSVDGNTASSINVRERVQKFSSNDSAGSRHSLSMKSSGSEKGEAPVEIKFFGTQRVVVPKRESLASH